MFLIFLEQPTYKPAPNPMKKTYLFLFTILINSSMFAQDFCTDADSNLIYAYSNIKDAYESNNLDHLKYYSNKSLESLEKAKVNLKKCGCDKAYNLVYNVIELVAKIEEQNTFEDGRFFVKRTKEITHKSITALNEFTISSGETDISLVEETNSTTKKLTDLQDEKEKLIKNYKEGLALNIKTYNTLLKRYGSDYNISTKSESKSELLNKDTKEIKAYFIESIKQVTNLFLAELNEI
ncbi:hypothetical protein N1F78_01925 [Seonamhaeicola sp. MEBiC1930]|uniref:hypothetical protein n=1 Tax=Seonamhaeicola sp. MEBiC01930 TaxID=2976768 RepID=UPI00324F8FB8